MCVPGQFSKNLSFAENQWLKMISHPLKTTRNFELAVLAAESQLLPAQESVYACLCVYGVQVEAGSLSGSKSGLLHWASTVLEAWDSNLGTHSQFSMSTGH